MSLSQPKKTGNPAKKFIEWKSSIGFFYYDKELKKDVVLKARDDDQRLFIIALDELTTITGWNDASSSQIYSNEVHSLKDEVLDVKSFKGGRIAKGLYGDIKNDLKGGAYCKSIYAALIKGKDDIELVNLKLSSKGLGSWIDAKNSINGDMLELDINPEIQKKGTNKYYIPKIINHGARPDILDNCKSMDVELQAFLEGNTLENRESSDDKAIEKARNDEYVPEANSESEPPPF
jgi:hypothetical protein